VIACRRALPLVLALAAWPACTDRELGGGDSNTALDPMSHAIHFPIAGPPHAFGAELLVDSAGSKVKLDCNTCHGPFDSFAKFSCIESGCHGQAPTDASHLAKNVAKYSYSQISCYGCHPDGRADSSQNHNLFFPINPTDTHGNIDCQTCHADSTNRKNITCVGGVCHPQAATDPPAAHNGVDGYEYVSASCYGCHPNGVAAGSVGHEKLFPIAVADKHSSSNPNTANIRCNSCHTDPANRKNISCSDTVACHVRPDIDVRHAVLSRSYGPSGTECIRCHNDAPPLLRYVAQHKFVVSPVSKHKDSTSTCFDCHQTLRTDNPWATDFPKLNCQGSGCHPVPSLDETGAHSGRPYDLNDPVGCLASGCHPNGRKP